MGRMKRWIAGAFIVIFIGGAAVFAANEGMCEFADVYWERAQQYAGVNHDLSLAYQTAWGEAMADCDSRD